MAQTKLLTLTKNKFKIIVKTNAPQNKIVEKNSETNTWKIEINAPPQKNKANIEITKFLTKQTGKKIKIISGLKSKQKICQTT